MCSSDLAPCRNFATLVCGAIQPWHGSFGDGSCMYVYVDRVHLAPRCLDTLGSSASAPIPLKAAIADIVASVNPFRLSQPIFLPYAVLYGTNVRLPTPNSTINSAATRTSYREDHRHNNLLPYSRIPLGDRCAAA